MVHDMRNEMITLHTLRRFYIGEPIGGGGSAVLASIGVDIQDNVEFAKTIGT